MTPPKSGLAPSGTVSGGAFDELPGSPWKTPPKGKFDGFAIPAMTAMKHYASDEVGEATLRTGDLELIVRAVYTLEDLAGRTVRVFQFIADEFEVLMLFPEDMSEMHLSFRGSKVAFAEAAELLRSVGDKALLKNPLSAAH